MCERSSYGKNDLNKVAKTLKDDNWGWDDSNRARKKYMYV